MSQREQETTHEETGPEFADQEQEGTTDGGPELRQEQPESDSAKAPSSYPQEGDEAVTSRPQAAADVESGEERAPLLANEEAQRFRRRWEDLQAGFVDEPRQMVEEADDLVGELMKQLTAGFSDERSNLEAQWERGEDVSTEELRVALTRYRSFFNRLLSA
jgi:hypothetical protein